MMNCWSAAMVEEGVNATKMKLFSAGMVMELVKVIALKLGP